METCNQSSRRYEIDDPRSYQSLIASQPLILQALPLNMACPPCGFLGFLVENRKMESTIGITPPKACFFIGGCDPHQSSKTGLPEYPLSMALDMQNCV